MQEKFKQHKHYLVGAGGLPKSLVDRLYWIPEYFDPTKHPLSPYLDERIIPKPGLDILLLQDFEDYYYQLDRHHLPFGVYISALKYGMKEKGLEDPALDMIRKDYGITTARAVLFPDDKIKYGVLIHELLHDAFNNLQNADREKILNAAKADYTKSGSVYFFASILLSALGLSTHNDLHQIDEFIGYLFYYKINFSLEGGSFSKSNPLLPEKFRKTMRDVGYKV